MCQACIWGQDTIVAFSKACSSSALTVYLTVGTQKKTFFTFRFSVLDPKEVAGQVISGRLFCTPKALWKLNWFLRDFGYDDDLFERDEVDERALPGLKGVLRTSYTTRGRRVFQNLDAFAPAMEWAVAATPTVPDKENGEACCGL